MASNNDSQCYFVQLQIDSFLDGEMDSAQQAEFHAHVGQCAVCAQELKFAHMLHESIVSLPQLDCEDAVLEPIHRLGAAEPEQRSWWRDTLAWLDSMPVFARYALPALLVALIMLPFVFTESSEVPGQMAPPLLAEQGTGPESTEYSTADVQKALADLNLAMQYLNQVGLRTEVMIGDRFLVTPVRDSVRASFEKGRDRTDVPPRSDPIF